MTQSPATERRRFSRVGFAADATIEQHGCRHPVQLLDISVKGALVHVEAHEKIDEQPATLAIALADGPAITMQMTLIHRQGGSLGFQCDSIDLDSAAHLRRLIELNLNSPDAAERVLEEMLSRDGAGPA